MNASFWFAAIFGLGPHCQGPTLGKDSNNIDFSFHGETGTIIRSLFVIKRLIAITFTQVVVTGKVQFNMSSGCGKMNPTDQRG